MKAICYTACLIVVMFFGSCTKAGLYEQNAKTLDSLSGAVSSIAKELANVDTIVLQKSIMRFDWYKQFIQQNINDTISKEEADNLQQFYASGKSLENFSLNRKMILERAALINAQLARLNADVKNRSLTVEQLSRYSLNEKNAAAKLIELGYQQQNSYHSGLQEFKNSLKGVELLIRSRNKGELPTIIKDTVSL